MKHLYLLLGTLTVLGLAFADYHGMTLWQTVEAAKSPSYRAGVGRSRRYGGYHHK